MHLQMGNVLLWVTHLDTEGGCEITRKVYWKYDFMFREDVWILQGSKLRIEIASVTDFAILLNRIFVIIMAISILFCFFF